MPLHSLSYGGNDIAVLNFPPDWDQGGVTIEHGWRTAIDTGLTGREDRSPEGAGLRLTTEFSVFMDADEAHALRFGLAALGSMLVGVPLCPARLAGADWGTRLYDAETIFDVTNQVIRAGDYAVAAGDIYVPLAVGHFDGGLPKITPITETMAQVTFSIVDDADWEYRVDINGIGSAGTWPAALAPDWQSAPSDEPIDGLTFEEISLARVRGIEGEEFAFRWGQEATFVLVDRTEIRALLAFFAASKGPHVPFTAPWWFKPGASTTATPHSTLARFGGERLRLGFTTDSFAAARVRVLQVPWEISPPAGEDATQPARCHFYKITHAIPAAEVWRFTNWEAPVTRTGDGTYTPALFTHREIKRGLRLDDDEVQVDSWNFAGNPLLRLLPYTLEAKLLLEIREGDPDDPDAAALIWAGSFSTKPDQRGRRINATARILGGILEREVPTFLVQHGCNYAIYSTSCGLAKGDFAKAGTFSGASGTELTIATAATDAANTFAGGWVEIGSGSTWERRGIKASAPGSGVQVFTIDRAVRQAAAGQTVTFYRGCDGLPATCQALGNYDRFGGHPFVPQDNPTLKASELSQTVRKK